MNAPLRTPRPTTPMTSLIEQGTSLAGAIDHDLVATFLTKARGAIRRRRSSLGRTGASAEVVAVAVRVALGVPLT
jgi:hypothetical protein